MKLISTVYNYTVKNSEMTGIWTEKILCDILKIPFNSKRNYITSENYPLFIKQDIEKLKPQLLKLNIVEHSGHLNHYYDFKTLNNSTVSLKTNISGNRVSPQNIGQSSLNSFNCKTEYNVKSLLDYKLLLLNNKSDIVNLYLSHLFCCNDLILFKFEHGKMFHFKKINNSNVKLNIQDTFIKPNKKLTQWDSGNNSLKVLIHEKFYQLCEFTIYDKKSTLVQCRFNINTIVLLINNQMISNLLLTTTDLENKYKINVKT
jgi:hypothetical protein